MTGFLQGSTVLGAAHAIIMKLDANSFLLTDDFTGVVYLIRKKGSTTTIAATEEPKAAPETATNPASEKPAQTCLSVVLLAAGGILTTFRSMI